jgi:nitrogen fixation NifU-like protein
VSDLSDLYQEMILDHGRRPRNHHAMDCPPARSAEGFNPFCGDRLTVYVRQEDGRLADLSFVGEGCAISQAAASMLTDALKGMTEPEARRVLDAYQAMIMGQKGAGVVGGSAAVAKLAVLEGVRRFPTRVKCATLAAHTLRAALEGQGEPVSTE